MTSSYSEKMKCVFDMDEAATSSCDLVVVDVSSIESARASTWLSKLINQLIRNK